MNRFSKALVILGALLVWYALIGFLIAPPLIRHFGQTYLQTHFSESSTISKVRINPFSGSLRVEGLSLIDAAEAWSIAWQEAELNISAASVIQFYPVVDAIRLVGADLRYEKQASLPVNESKSPHEQGSDEAGGAQDWRVVVEQLNLTEIPELRVDLLEVADGRIEFVDPTAATVYRKTIDPINFTLRDLSTVVQGDTAMRFVAQTDEGATLRWEGDFQSQPIRSSGSFALTGLAVHELSPYYSQFIRFNLKRAVFGFALDYAFDLSDFENLLNVENGHVTLTDLLCVPIDTNDSLITVDSVAVEGIDFSFPKMLLEVATVQITSGETRIFRDADGQINLAELLVVPVSPEVDETVEVAATAQVEPASDDGALPSLNYHVGQVVLSDYRILWQEALHAGMVDVSAQIQELEISDISSDAAAPFQLKADYTIGDSGTVHIAGSIVPAEPTLDLSLSLQQLPLQLLSPYAQNFGKTQIETGTFSFDGRLRYAAAGEQALSGNAEIQGIDFIYDENLKAKWAKLEVHGLQMEMAPFALAMEAIILDQPDIVFTNTAVEVPVEDAEATSGEPDRTETSASEASPIRVEKFAVSKGRVTFIDQSVESAPQIVMDDLGLLFSGLDFAGSEPAEINLNTQINGSAFEIHGVLNASQFKETTRLKTSLSGLSLPAFSAYSGQAIGRRIASGEFNIESDWVIEASQLKAKNKIRIEHLGFGDRVESETALNLPIDLAVTLLQGPNGVMDISLPLSGDLSDPKVGIGQIVRTAIVGLITNVVAAPFNLLSGLVDSEEDLSVVTFEAGSAKLSQAMIDRLNALSFALKERPNLQLSIIPQLSTEDTLKLANGESDHSDGTALSAARGAIIREHLIAAHGITESRLSVAAPEVETSDSGARFELK